MMGIPCGHVHTEIKREIRMKWADGGAEIIDEQDALVLKKMCHNEGWWGLEYRYRDCVSPQAVKLMKSM